MPPDERRCASIDRADAQSSALEVFTTADPDRQWTVREIARHAAIGGRGPCYRIGRGSCRGIASWVEETDVDGFNLAYALTPGTFVDVADLVVPELQTPRAFQARLCARDVREKLFGAGRARLPASHPGRRGEGPPDPLAVADAGDGPIGRSGRRGAGRRRTESPGARARPALQPASAAPCWWRSRPTIRAGGIVAGSIKLTALILLVAIADPAARAVSAAKAMTSPNLAGTTCSVSGLVA